ncbi:MAG: heat-shock protein Hsp20 [Gammaproteobacteria bacterium]|nr:MAG: heat-shock protein Hsp20 [Gammaproteobacteria bacterium]
MTLIPRNSLMNMNSLFDDFFPQFRDRVENNGCVPLRVDIEEHDSNFTLKADMPGVKKEDINIELHDGVLTIKTEQKDEREEKTEGNLIRKERIYGSYLRSFTVGKGIAVSDISAEFVDGVLTLVVPKVSVEQAEPKRIEIS